MTIRSKPLRITLIVAAAVFVLLALFALIMALVFDRLFLALLAKKLAISPNSPAYDSWLVPKVPIYFKIYLFNVTNLDDVLAGGRPHLQLVGPYVYRERRERFDVVFGDGPDSDKVRFKYRIFYFFDEKLSIGHPSSVNITAPSIFYAGVHETGFSYMLSENIQPFVTLTAEEYLWGYYPSAGFLFSLLSSKKVGLFNKNNGTNVNEFLVNTGANNIQDVGKIYEVNGKTVMNIWDYPEANAINGTDGTIAPPGLRVGSTVEFHVPDICRSVTSYAVNTTTTQARDDVEVTVFSGSPPDPTDPVAKWRTNMFCKKKSGCPPKGLLSLGPCIAQKEVDIPLYLSQPFFLDAEPNISKAFDGLPTPSKAIHSTWVHIEPITGFVLEAFKRIQFNVFMKNDDSRYKNMAGPYYFPLAWIEETAIADQQSVDMLANMILVPRKKMPIIFTVVGSVSAALAVVIILVLVLCVRTRSISHRAKRNGTVSPTPPAVVSAKESKLDPFSSVTSAWGDSKSGASPTQSTEAKPLLHATSDNAQATPVA